MSNISTAAVLVIGDEILSGRTKDKNIGTIADRVAELGIDLKEVRIVSDEHGAIIDAVNALRTRYTYVLTTGGIGPTHDDITADCIAKAFGVSIDVDSRAVDVMLERYSEEELTPSRLRMARIPDGASLLNNPISKAPGFQIGNVFVMAGVPSIMSAMLDDVTSRMTGGQPILSETIDAGMGEGAIAEPLGHLQQRYPEIAIGSYPYMRDGKFQTSVVLKGRNQIQLDAAKAELKQILADIYATDTALKQ